MKGRTLEKLVECSRSGVVLFKIPNGTKYLPGGRSVPTKTLVDFLGCESSTGRLICLDCKERVARDSSFRCDDKTLKPHQRQHLLDFHKAGAVSGVLAMDSAGSVYWFPAWMLDGVTSLKWESAAWTGDGDYSINWAAMIAAHNLAFDRWKLKGLLKGI